MVSSDVIRIMCSCTILHYLVLSSSISNYLLLFPVCLEHPPCAMACSIAVWFYLHLFATFCKHIPEGHGFHVFGRVLEISPAATYIFLIGKNCPYKVHDNPFIIWGVSLFDMWQYKLHVPRVTVLFSTWRLNQLVHAPHQRHHFNIHACVAATWKERMLNNSDEPCSLACFQYGG